MIREIVEWGYSKKTTMPDHKSNFYKREYLTGGTKYKEGKGGIKCAEGAGSARYYTPETSNSSERKKKGCFHLKIRRMKLHKT